MFDHNHYVPVLKWRMGEYQALFRLSAKIKDWVTPLIELPTEGWDFENECPAKSLDDHLRTFGARLKAKWGERICFIDSPYLDGDAKMASGQHHLEYVFELADEMDCQPIPVIGLRRSNAYVNAVKTVVKSYARGACLRLTPDDFNAGLGAKISALLGRIGLNEKGVDLVIDSSDGVSASAGTQALLWLAILQQVPNLAKWHTVTVVGTAFPAALTAARFRPHGRAGRHEWTGYQHMVNTLPKPMRVPTFGDYATSHPHTEALDPRMLDPNAKIKYAVDDEWVVVVGTQVKKNGRGQYVNLCSSIVNSKPSFYSGSGYSWGDKYVADCANGVESTGGTSTWPSVATNHHITKAVRDVAIFHGALASP